jgi:hypothetical protein
VQYKNTGATQIGINMNESDGITVGLKKGSNVQAEPGLERGRVPTSTSNAEESEAAA